MQWRLLGRPLKTHPAIPRTPNPHDSIAPVFFTIAVSWRRTAVEPIFASSPPTMATGSDSPVRAAWSTCSASLIQCRHIENHSSTTTHNINPSVLNKNPVPNLKVSRNDFAIGRNSGSSIQCYHISRHQLLCVKVHPFAITFCLYMSVLGYGC